ncbi:MAG: Type 1 glutamine amidotransferase-like domain-containing protein [Smithellaceae bacterium]
MTGSKSAPLILIAGGPQANNNDVLLAAALKLSPAPKPTVAYIGTASDDDRTFFNMINSMLIVAGAAYVTLVPIVKRFDRTRAEAILTACDLIFLSGGEVARGMEFLKKRSLIPFLTSLYKSGKPFCGVSAGSIMLCCNWMRWRDENDDNTVELMDCLGFAPLLCDVHEEDDDWEEMKRLLSFFPAGTKGYGIPAGGALHVTPTGKVTSLGADPLLFIRKGNKIVLKKTLITH